jgi:hypothetical protein
MMMTEMLQLKCIGLMFKCSKISNSAVTNIKCDVKMIMNSEQVRIWKDDDVDCGLLCCDAMWFCRWLPTFL